MALSPELLTTEVRPAHLAPSTEDLMVMQCHLSIFVLYIVRLLLHFLVKGVDMLILSWYFQLCDQVGGADRVANTVATTRRQRLSPQRQTLQHKATECNKHMMTLMKRLTHVAWRHEGITQLEVPKPRHRSHLQHEGPRRSGKDSSTIHHPTPENTVTRSLGPHPKSRVALSRLCYLRKDASAVTCTEYTYIHIMCIDIYSIQYVTVCKYQKLISAHQCGGMLNGPQCT